jgi:hypothetical protein
MRTNRFGLSFIIRVVLCLILVLPGMALRPASGRAAPRAGGVFSVNSSGDNTTKDANLTLREAVLIDQGGTGAGGLGRTLADGERRSSLAVRLGVRPGRGRSMAAAASGWRMKFISAPTISTLRPHSRR